MFGDPANCDVSVPVPPSAAASSALPATRSTGDLRLCRWHLAAVDLVSDSNDPSLL